MTLAVQVRVSGFDVPKFCDKMRVNLPKHVGDGVYQYATGLAQRLAVEAQSDSKRPLTPDRQRAAALIKARRMTRLTSVITMPRSLVLLDAMQPPYVSLKRGRGLVDWAKKYYGRAVVSGRSNVRIGPRGGVSGFMYVTPHKFVQKTLMQERNKLPNHLRRSVKKAYSESRSYKRR